MRAWCYLSFLFLSLWFLGENLASVEDMRIHPAPRKRNITFRCGVNPAASAAAVIGQQKKLRRLPHIFSKVLELPVASEADVAVEEDEDSLRFFVAADGLRGEVRAHAIEIHPGVMKVVVRDDGCGSDDLDKELEVGLWRFRLPPSSQPMLASAAYADGELVVTIPKGMDPEEESGGFLEF